MTSTATLPRLTVEVRPSVWSSDLVRVLALVVSWQFVLTVIGVVAESVLGGRPAASLLSHTGHWDGGWFIRILNGEYATSGAAPAFYPLFPFSVRVLQWITFDQVSALAAGLLINTVAMWLGTTALLKIARHFLGGRKAPWLIVSVYLVSPAAFFLHEFYSEATFTALAFGAYLFALRGRWTLMGLCLIPLTASRITAILFVGLCFLEFWRARGWRWRGLLTWPVLWFPASGLGFLTYALYLQLVAGDPWAMTKAYRATNDWPYHVFNPNIFQTLAVQAHVSWRTFTRWDGYDFVNSVLPLLGLMLLLAASAYLVVRLRGAGVPLAVFGVMSFIMFTLNSNLVSVYRYLLPCLGIYLALVLAIRHRPALRPILLCAMAISLGLQLTLMCMFSASHWAG